MSFYGGLQNLKALGCPDVEWEGIPQSLGSYRKGSVPPGLVPGPRHHQEQLLCRPQCPKGGVVVEEVREVGWSQAMKGFVGRQ